MDSFLDSTVIINYFEYNYKIGELKKKCFDYVEFSKGKILTSFIVQDEVRRVILKRKEMYGCILRKVKDPSYEITYNENIKFLNKEDIKFTHGLYLKLKDKSINNLEEDFGSEIVFLNASLRLFLRKRINEISITKSDLDSSVLSIIHDFIDDFADCRVLTSAIQIQQNKEIFFFVTADQHFDPNGYNFIKTEPKLENYKFPNLKNFLYED